VICVVLFLAFLVSLRNEMMEQIIIRVNFCLMEVTETKDMEDITREPIPRATMSRLEVTETKDMEPIPRATMTR
jgi:hypothetical protein